tara:strand:+ start:254 stop:637 length:384 start_codon:yes stop_codon:yes gene_type:complete
MNVKERVKLGYDLFNKHDMETFFKELVDENTTWTFPGKEGVHPLSGVHSGPQAMMAAFSKIPEKWTNLTVTPMDMISEDNKVFVRVKATADGMDTIFGHYFEVDDNGKMKTMMTFDDTLTMYNAIKK